MKLIDGWKQILAGSWSVRFGAAAAVFGGLAAATAPGGEISAAFPALESVFGLESGTLAALASLAGLLGIGARLIPQPKVHEKIAEAALNHAVAKAKDQFPIGSEEWLAALRREIGK
jgi:hypothetical protein